MTASHKRLELSHSKGQFIGGEERIRNLNAAVTTHRDPEGLPEDELAKTDKNVHEDIRQQLDQRVGVEQQAPVDVVVEESTNRILEILNERESGFSPGSAIISYHNSEYYHMRSSS